MPFEKQYPLCLYPPSLHQQSRYQNKDRQMENKTHTHSLQVFKCGDVSLQHCLFDCKDSDLAGHMQPIRVTLSKELLSLRKHYRGLLSRAAILIHTSNVVAYM